MRDEGHCGARTENRAQPPEPAAGTAPRQHILVIEDDPMVRFNILSYLEDSGFRVSEESDGARGVAAALAGTPDLVLCDLRMPGLDGLDVLATLRAERPDLPLVVVSGTGVLGDAVEALRQGAWDFIAKPIQDMAILDHIIAGVLDKSQLIRENRRYQSELEQANRQLRAHVERFEQDAAAGRTTQLQLMPPGERRLGDYRLERCLLPSLYLSGDFVDYFPIGSSHIGLYLADVSGHGVASAFVTVLLSGYVRRRLDLLESEGDGTVLVPECMLAQLNRDLLGQNLDKYLTIFYGVIDLDRNRLRYSNGGHFPNPVLFDGTSSRFLEGRGPPVGLFPDARFATVEMDLPDGHVLVLFSDGVLDALPERTLSSKRARLLGAVSRPDLHAGEVLSSLGIRPDAGYPDDITLLIAQRGLR